MRAPALAAAVVAAAVAASLAWDGDAAVEADRVLALPGWEGELPSRMYSGYLNISASKHLHYIFVEKEPAGGPSMRSGNADGPLDGAVAVNAWFNGGPGCSSLDGFVYENGPFRLVKGDPHRLERFPYAWSKLSHMLYVEQPVGVGFSYSDDESEYVTDDDQSGLDNLAAIEKFYELYPELRDSELVLTGESYAGIYIPVCTLLP